MIVFVHLLNDRSGSPRVLRNVMEALAGCYASQQLFIGSGGDGFLNQVGAQVRRYPYRRHTNRWATLLSYLASQWTLFSSLRRASDIAPDAVVYVNTLLPFGAALYGRLTGRRVICHLHEVSLRPWLLHWFLLRVARWSAHRVICVSAFHRQRLGLGDDPAARVVVNSIDPALFDAGMRSVYAPLRDGIFTVCMLCSLRDYKGVPEFLQLAHQLAHESRIRFQLVVSDDAAAVQRYFAGKDLPPHLTLVRGVEDAAEIYAQASLVLNLSRVTEWQETFGLTLLEAMAFGVPVIAPPVGGPAELVEDGVHGYLIDSRDGNALRDAVERLASDEALCLRLSAQCRLKAQALSPQVFQADIRSAVFDT